MAGDLLSLLTGIPSLISLFSGSGSAPYEQEQKELAARQRQLSEAQTDINNPLYKQLYGQYQNQNQQNLAQVVAEAQRQQRLNGRLGRGTTTGREGEDLWRALMAQQAGVGQKADEQTRTALMDAMKGNASASGAYNQLTPYSMNRDAARLSGFRGIQDILNPNPNGVQISQLYKTLGRQNISGVGQNNISGAQTGAQNTDQQDQIRKLLLSQQQQNTSWNY